MPAYKDPYSGNRNAPATIAEEIKRKITRCTFSMPDHGVLMAGANGLSREETQRINALIAQHFNNWYQSNIEPLLDEIIAKRKS